MQRPRWHSALNELRCLQTELQRLEPYRDDGLIPETAANVEMLNAAEARLAMQLPPSYRDFLLRHNGWKRFFDGAHLLGSHELGQAAHVTAAHTLLGGVLRIRGGEPSRLLPFAVDSRMCSVFAFDVNCASPEKPVVAWVRELGVQRSNFPDFLELLVEIAAAELHSSRLTGAVNLSPDTAASAA